MQVTRDVLVKRFELAVSAALEAGITEAGRWHLEIGSKTYGHAYHIWLAHENYEAGLRGELPEGEWRPGHYAPVINSYLGMTASEAFNTLSNYENAFRAVKHGREQS